MSYYVYLNNLLWYNYKNRSVHMNEYNRTDLSQNFNGDVFN